MSEYDVDSDVESINKIVNNVIDEHCVINKNAQSIVVGSAESLSVSTACNPNPISEQLSEPVISVNKQRGIDFRLDFKLIFEEFYKAGNLLW